MNRRQFVTTVGAAAATLTTKAQAGEKQQYIEMKKIITLLGDKKKVLNEFLEKVEIPALNRMGISTVGVFSVKYGLSEPTLFMLLPHNSLDTVVNNTDMLMADEEYVAAGKEFLSTPLSDPNYFRIESTLMRAFVDMPTVEIPEAIKGKKGRIFEMRIYESHSRKAGKKKVAMFNKGGEIAIFRKTNLQPVFFGETLIGPKMPNLTYMLGFESMKQRDKHWAQFGPHPDWQALRAKEEYKGTVSNITDFILSPTAYSQI
jgi:hypothetical protein